uniref:RING-type E3 ubiquitin transferase n=1 Tax=Setaria digitata TaxID=48799 RepID=A0A915PGG9_9BILA
MPSEETTHGSSAAELEELDAKKLRQDCLNIMSNGNSNEDGEAYKLDRLRNLISRIFCGENSICLKSLLESTDTSTFSSNVDLSVVIDDIFMRTLCSIQKNNVQVMDTGRILGKQLGEPLFDLPLTLPEMALQYLITTNEKLITEEQNQFLMDYERSVIPVIQKRLFVQASFLLRGFYGQNFTAEDMIAVFVRMFYQQQIPEAFAYSLITYCVDDDVADHDALSEIFNPILDCAQKSMSCQQMSNKCNREVAVYPYSLLKFLVGVKTSANKRPVADLLVSRADFISEVYSMLDGHEFARLCYLGPFFEYSTAPADNGSLSVYMPFFDCSQLPEDEQKPMLYNVYQNDLTLVRRHLHQILHQLLANTSSRNRTLDFITRVLTVNIKRRQMNPDHSKLSSDGFMLNFFDVMLSLAEKVTFDKVNTYYIFHPKCRIDFSDETRLKLDLEQAKAFAKMIDTNFEIKFPTECFFLTMQAQHLSLSAAIGQLKYLKRNLHEIELGLTELKAQLRRLLALQIREKAMIEAKLERANIFRTRLIRSVMCLEAALYDPVFLHRALEFCSRQLTFVINIINPNFMNDGLLPPVAPELFGAMPEFFLENSLDFIVFLLKNNPVILLESRLDLPQQLLVFICSAHYFNNKFLAAKIVEVLFMVCPAILPAAYQFHLSVINSPLAIDRLFPSLVKFYADVESTGASTEFYDKFNIRRSIQVIFRSLWESTIYRSNITSYARECSPDFIRFVNMVINDATYLLDESLLALKKIHDIETLKESNEWSNLGEEERQMKEDALLEAKRGVRNWLILGRDTLDLFTYLTADAPEPFYEPLLGERLASMLDYNVSQLCGPKCTELKVRDAVRRFMWEPRALLQQIVNVYLNLSSEKFAECIANDERSYSPDVFSMVLTRLTANSIVPINEIELLKNLADMTERIWKQKAQNEEDFGDDVPDDFRDPVMNTLMTDPVILPSGHKMDRKHIMRHLLSSQTDPFTRQPLSETQLVSDDALRTKIRTWMKEKLASKSK